MIATIGYNQRPQTSFPIKEGKCEIIDRALGYFCSMGPVPKFIIEALRTGKEDDETREGFLVDEVELIKRMSEYRASQNAATRCMGPHDGHIGGSRGFS